MKRIVYLIILLFVSKLSFCQISRNEITPLFNYLESEKFSEAYKLSDKLIDKYEKDTSYMMGIVRYAYLYSGAALIENKQITYKKLKTGSERLNGKFIVMAGHSTTMDTTKIAYNTNILKEVDGRIVGSTTSISKTHTCIYFFEYFVFKNSFNISNYDKLNTRCGGILNKIEFNPNESTIWIMRLYIKDAIIKKM